ncbi:MAG: hypothetical protein M3381_09310 [Actinomycetota bacterium]|nr:hypothetical protein [Actinomycetota bacterium]
MITERGWRTAAVVLSAVALSGCSSLSPDGATADDAAVAFHDALSSSDSAQACDLLAEGTRRELEQSADTPCDDAILEEGLPTADQVVEVAAYGRNARVILDGDIEFLTVEGGEWKVIAAGCEFQPNAPYDCSLKGS